MKGLVDMEAHPPADPANAGHRRAWIVLGILLPLLVAGTLATRSPVRHVADMPPPVGDVQLDPGPGFQYRWPGLRVRARTLGYNRTLQLKPRADIQLPSPFISFLDAETGEESVLGHVTFARAEDVPLPPEGRRGELLVRTPFHHDPLYRTAYPFPPPEASP